MDDFTAFLRECAKRLEAGQSVEQIWTAYQTQTEETPFLS